jgi:hypothetical protein
MTFICYFFTFSHIDRIQSLIYVISKMDVSWHPTNGFTDLVVIVYCALLCSRNMKFAFSFWDSTPCCACFIKVIRRTVFRNNCSRCLLYCRSISTINTLNSCCERQFFWKPWWSSRAFVLNFVFCSNLIFKQFTSLMFYKDRHWELYVQHCGIYSFQPCLKCVHWA